MPELVSGRCTNSHLSSHAPPGLARAGRADPLAPRVRSSPTRVQPGQARPRAPAAPGGPVSADVTCAENLKARLFISKERGAQGPDELSRDLCSGSKNQVSPEAGPKHREVRAASSAQSGVSVHATLRQIKPASYPPAISWLPRRLRSRWAAFQVRHRLADSRSIRSIRSIRWRTFARGPPPGS